MFFLEEPSNFLPKMNIVICYCIWEDKILFLRRTSGKFQGEMWTAPGGKKENHELSSQGIVREVFEETGISLQEKDLQYTGCYYVRNEGFDYRIEIFKTYLSCMPTQINLSPREHDNYQWVTWKEALELPLVPEADQCLLQTFTQ